MSETMKKLRQGATRLFVLVLGLGLASTVRAADSIEETGATVPTTETLAFKGATLSQLTARTLSGVIGGDWAGAVAGNAMTFNNFDRSSEASGTITCQAQIQHDSNVKGVLLAFIQDGDNVKVKKTGAKYISGTVGQSIAGGSDGYYDVSKLKLTLPNAIPNACWVGNFPSSQTANVGGVSINPVNGSSTVSDGIITYGNPNNANGPAFWFDAVGYVAVVFTVDFTGVTLAENQLLVSFGNGYYNTLCGAALKSDGNGAFYATGIWQNGAWTNTDDTSNTFTLSGEKTFIATYDKGDSANKATRLYVLEDGVAKAIYIGSNSSNNLKGGDVTKFGIAGAYGSSGNFKNMAGLKLKKMAMYLSSSSLPVTASDLPSHLYTAKYSVANGETINASTINSAVTTFGCAYVSTEAGATLNLDAALDGHGILFDGSISGVPATGLTLGSANDKVTLTDASYVPVIKGYGTVAYPNNTIPSSDSTTWLTSLDWAGTLSLSGIQGSSSGQPGWYAPFHNYGSSNSTIKVSGFTGFFGAGNFESPATLEIAEGSTFTLNNGNGGNSMTFAKLTGSGDIVISGDNTPAIQYVMRDASEFAGNITVSQSGSSVFKKSIVLGGGSSYNYNVNNYQKQICVLGNVTIAAGKTWTADSGIVVNGKLTLAASTSTLTGTVTGSGRVVFTGALPSSSLQTSFQDSANWTGTVELKNYEQTTAVDSHRIINLNTYGNSNSTVALNGVTSTMYAVSGTYPAVTLKSIEIGEGGWTDTDNSYSATMLYTAQLTGHGPITVKTRSSGTVKFIGDHTFDGSVIMDSGTGKQVAFMRTSSDAIPDVTARAIVVAGRLDMSIASGNTWTAPGGIKIDGSLTVLTDEAATATSVTPTAYRDGAEIETSVDAVAGTTTYSTGMVVSDNQGSMGDVTVVGDQSISGSGGAYMSSLTIDDGATLTYDPVITPIRVESAPVFNGTGKLKLATRYAGVTCGKFHLVSYPSSASVSGTLADLIDSTSFNNATYTVTEETVGSYKQLVLKVGDYDTNAKDISIAQFGDSITEGIWRDGYRGTPNYRIPLMQLLEAYGYRPEARGYRSVGSTDANGVPADDNYKWHTGISAQRIYTGLTGSSLRAGFMESIEAHLEQVGVTDVITLKIGTNDSIGNETADNMFEGWSNLVWKIVRMRPTSKIVVCAPVKIRSGENNAPGLRTKIAEYMALTHAEGGFPDGQVTMINGINIVTDDANHYLTDNVHPNWNGHLQLANAWLTAVTTAFESMTARATEGYTAQTVASAENATELADYRDGYVKLATFTNVWTKLSTWDETPYYYVNDGYKDMPMKRVAYFVARKTTASPDTRYVWVDMDADETTGMTLADFGVPTSASVNGVVNNLHIYSNSSAIENVAPTVSGVKGTLMRTEKGVSKADGISTTLAPTGPYGFDWNDSIGSGSWGVMNMARIFDGATPTDHRKLLAAQMLFDFNGFNGSRQNALGLGDFAVHGPYNTANGSVDHFNLNWTFTTTKDDMPTMDATALETGVIEIWGKPMCTAAIATASNFSELTFSPGLPQDYSDEDLLIIVPDSTSVTLTIDSATTVGSIRFVVPSTSNLTIAGADNLTAGKVFVGRTTESLKLVGSVADANLAVVSHNETIADDGELSIDGVKFDGIATATMTLVKPDGTTTNLTGSVEGGVVSFSWAPTVKGAACWCDYEMVYEKDDDSKTGFENTGSDSTGLNSDSGITGSDAFTTEGMLYTYAHPWRDIDYPADGNWTAVVRCTVPKYENAAVITFGTCTGGLIGLVAGADPETQMKLVKTTGNSAFTTLATMTVVNATTAQHVYVFSVENNQTIKVYCDGQEVLNQTFATFTLGGGIQIGSVHGGKGNTGIVRFAKDESPANTLTEKDQKAARIDCVRLFKGVLGPNAIRQLSVEYPAVKLFQATISGGNDNVWGTLPWTGGDISTINSDSKAIITVADDATLTLPASITADELVIDVASGKTLTLAEAAGGTTLTIGHPIEVNTGSVAFDASNKTLDLAIAGTGYVFVDTGKTISVVSGGSLSKLSGAGTVTYASYGSLPSALTFGDWTGTVVLPSFTANGENLNNYGKSGSTIALTGITSGWISPGNTTVAAALRLDGAVNITAMSQRNYSFAKIGGPGNLSFATTGDQPTSVTIGEVAEGYTGTISSTLTMPVTITTLARAAGTSTAVGTKLLSKSGNITVGGVTIGGSPLQAPLAFTVRTDGVYIRQGAVLMFW